MAQVVLLRGINVGGHKTLRPTELARQLRHLDPVSIGAAGTFVVRRRVGRAQLRAELARRLPFEAEIMICDGREILEIASRDWFAGRRLPSGSVRFASILARRPRATLRLPLRLPPEGPCLLEVVAREGRFVVGFYRRHMKVIGHLRALDRLFGVPATTRNWNTLTAVAEVLREDRGRGAGPTVASASRRDPR